MKVISTNIGTPREVNWKGKLVQTGIFKYPVTDSIFLDKTDVRDDHVIDRRYHGGVDKAFYLYGANHYPFWKSLYPNLDWSYGMFGENITVDNCREDDLYIGSIYQIGSAKVQVVQPRQPCFKLGIRFEDQGILKHFVNETKSGVYFRVLESGEVITGDEIALLEAPTKKVSIAQLYQAVYRKLDNPEVMNDIIEHTDIPISLREYVAGLVG